MRVVVGYCPGLVEGFLRGGELADTVLVLLSGWVYVVRGDTYSGWTWQVRSNWRGVSGRVALV